MTCGDRKADYEQKSEPVLIFESLAGDQKASEEIVRRYHGRLLYYIRRILGTSADAEDVLQDVWLGVFQQLPNLRDAKAFPAWIYRIARNQATQILRKRRQILPLDESQVPSNIGDPRIVFTKEEAAMVHVAMAQLTLQHREVLLLRFLEDMSCDEIAAVTGCKEGTVKSRLHYAKHSLRRIMEEMDDG